MKFSVFMVGSLLRLNHLTRLEILIGFKRCLMKVQCAIFYGQIQMKEQVGEFLQEVLGTHLDKTFLNNLTEQMI